MSKIFCRVEIRTSTDCNKHFVDSKLFCRVDLNTIPGFIKKKNYITVLVICVVELGIHSHFIRYFSNMISEPVQII